LSVLKRWLGYINGVTPNLYGYLDYRRFLQDWFEAKKRATPSFSYRNFARRAGQKSPSLLHHVMGGKRNLTPATTEAFARAMGLKVAEVDFFRHLVKLDQAKTSSERNQAWAKISATRNFREARHVEGAGFDYLSHWYYPAIRELVMRSDFQSDPAWVASQLRPTISTAKARRALDALQAMELLVDGDDGLRVAEASVVTPHEVAGLAVHNYHQGMLGRAMDAIDAFDPEERHLGAVTAAIPASLVQTLKDEVTAFQERILDLCDRAEGEPDIVYQLNLQLFPLSASREDS
jgi:uncharacterized protein (TIGR02147 family)